MSDIQATPRSSNYQSPEKVVSNRKQENQELTKEIHLKYLESKKRKRPPKIHESLLTKGFPLSLNKARIRSITKKKYRTYPSNEKVIQFDNLLKRDFTTQTINKKWVIDITYIHTL